MKHLLVIISFIFAAANAQGNEATGKVTNVIDGNTIEVQAAAETFTIVLADIDSPELTQEYGDKAKELLEKIILKKEVLVQFQGKDRKGNHLAVVLIKGKVDPRVELLREGLAWTSEKNPVPDLEVHRTSAKEKGKGLWKEENPTPPWTYRRQQTMLAPKSS